MGGSVDPGPAVSIMDTIPWQAAWGQGLGALAAIAAACPVSAAGSQAVLALERVVLAPGLFPVTPSPARVSGYAAHPSAASPLTPKPLLTPEEAAQVFSRVLLPLVETLCHTPGAAPGPTQALSGGPHFPGVAGSRGPQGQAPAPTTASSSGSPGGGQRGSGGFGTYLLPSVLLSAVFGPMAGAATTTPTMTTMATPTTKQSGGLPGGEGASTTTAVDREDSLQCRGIALLGKAFLHLCPALLAHGPGTGGAANRPPGMALGASSSIGGGAPPVTAAWKAIVGTLYALYSSSSSSAPAGPMGNNAANHCDGGDDDLLQEAIEAALQNTIAVLLGAGAGGGGGATLLVAADPLFWPVTVALVAPFRFPAAHYLGPETLEATLKAQGLLGPM